MNPQIEESWIAGETAVATAQLFFVKQGCPFSEIRGPADFGKDAVVELSYGQSRELKHSIFLQIKGGRSFQRASGNFFIPVENHASYWKTSKLPVIGLVHQQNTEDLYWCNLTQYLQDNPDARSVPLNKSTGSLQNTMDTIKKSVEDWFSEQGAGPTIRMFARLCDADSKVQNSALLDCIAAARTEPQVLTVLRYLILRLQKEALHQLIYVLVCSQFGGNTDHEWQGQPVYFSRDWLSDSYQELLEQHFSWTAEEVMHMLRATDCNNWQANAVNDVEFALWILLASGGKGYDVLEDVACRFVATGELCQVSNALELRIEQYGEAAGEELARILTERPELKRCEHLGKIEEIISESDGEYPMRF